MHPVYMEIPASHFHRRVIWMCGPEESWGMMLASLLVCACKGRVLLMPAVQPGLASPFFNNITKSIETMFTDLVRELR